jgi:hypothetical protein
MCYTNILLILIMINTIYYAYSFEVFNVNKTHCFLELTVSDLLIDSTDFYRAKNIPINIINSIYPCYGSEHVKNKSKALNFLYKFGNKCDIINFINSQNISS